MLKRLIAATLVALSATLTLTVLPAAASVSPYPVVTVPAEPDPPQLAPSKGLRGPKPGSVPSTTIKPIYTAYPGTVYGPSGKPYYPEEWICVAWDYIKKICTGWRNRSESSNVEIWNAFGGGPITNYIWVSPERIRYTRLGYWGTRQVDDGSGSTICIGWNYYINKCAMWRNWYPPLVQQFPVPNFLWVSPYDADYLDSAGYEWPMGLQWF